MLLDGTTVEFNLLPEVTGADCLEKVAQVMEIQEVSGFTVFRQLPWAFNIRLNFKPFFDMKQWDIFSTNF